jgi:glycosyltransferase involved in cell wall biosynthesis
MLLGHKIVVVMPAYNAAKTLKRTYDDVPKDIVDEILLVDDGSHDDTIKLSKQLGIRTFIHERNFGYGRNQKTCYREALKTGADVVVMVHPDYQYSPKLIGAIASLIAVGEYDVVIASRILGVGALKGGMPLYKFISNRFLTFFENIMLFHKLSEYHTGYRAFSRKVLETLPLMENSDDFIFDNEMLAQVIFWGYGIGEVSCPTKYFPEASEINFWRKIFPRGLGDKFLAQRQVWDRLPADFAEVPPAKDAAGEIRYLRRRRRQAVRGIILPFGRRR